MNTDELAVEIDHLRAWLPAAVESVIARKLTLSTTLFIPGGEYGYTRHTGVEHLYWRDPDGRIVVMAGLATRVIKILTEAGYKVTVIDHRRYRPKITPAPVLNDNTHPDALFLNTMAGVSRGTIISPSENESVRLAELICSRFPAANIMMVVAGDRRRIRRTREKLQAAGVCDASALQDYKTPYEGGRLVCGYHAFDRHDPKDFDLYIFCDAVTTVTRRRVDVYTRFRDQRVYAFIPSRRRIGEEMRLRLEQVFGPTIYRSPDPRGEEATVRVTWCQPPWAPPVRTLAPLERKRMGYWHNASRNDFLVSIAQGVVEGDVLKLGEHGIFLPEREVIDEKGRLAVTILVESTEHGKELLRRLPGWRLWVATPDSPSMEQFRDPFHSRWLDKVIITTVRAHSVKALDADVLIRAGGTGTVSLPGFPPRVQQLGEDIVLVDIADDFDKVAKGETRSRYAGYRARGWPSVGVPTWMTNERSTASVVTNIKVLSTKERSHG
jgi:hypothetical protein